LRPPDVEAGSRPALIGGFLLLFETSLARRSQAAYAVLSGSKLSDCAGKLGAWIGHRHAAIPR
jgi:hypothetical protein